MRIFKFISLLIAFTFLFGCSSTTVIKSQPKEAQVFIDGKLTCVTPCDYWDREVGMPEHKIELRKEGYKTLESKITKDNFAARRLFAFFLVIPLAYLYDYPEQYFFSLERDPNALPTAIKTEEEKTTSKEISNSNAGEIKADQKNIEVCVKAAKELGLSPVPQGKSVVYFYRPANMMTSLLSPSIYDNDRKVLSGLKNGNCWAYFIDPGEHVFSTRSATTTGSEVTIDSKNSGEDFYIRMDILMKAFVGETKLIKVYPDQGCKEMTGCKLVK